MKKYLVFISSVFLFSIIISYIVYTSVRILNEEPKPENIDTTVVTTPFNPTEAVLMENEQKSDKIIFQDSIVEAYTRSLLNIPNGDITESDVQKITVFGDSKNGNGSFGDISVPIKTLADFYHFKNLKKLVLSGCNISNLDGLESLMNLEELRLRRNDIIDISPLANLVNLRVLDLAENKINDLSPLSRLLKIEKLMVEGRNLDLEPLKNLKGLRELYIPFSGVSDISPLKNLINLTYLQLYHNNITDISYLRNMSHLNYLELSSNPIKDISVFDDLLELTYISIDNINLSEEQLWSHLYSRHWCYSSKSQPLVYVDVTINAVSEFQRTYKIQISDSKDISEDFDTFEINSASNIEGWSEYFIEFNDENKDGLMDLKILTDNSTKGMNYITFIFNDDTHKFIQN